MKEQLEQWLTTFGYVSLDDVEAELRDRHEKIVAAERRAMQLESELALLRAENERRRKQNPAGCAMRG